MKVSTEDYIVKRSEEVIVEMMSIMSGALYLLPIDKKDFTFKHIALNINHVNPVIKYAARSAAASGDSGSTLETYIQKHAGAVLEELKSEFDNEYYLSNPVDAHNLSIRYELEATRLKVFCEILVETGRRDDAEVLAKWLEINPVQQAVGDWV